MPLGSPVNKLPVVLKRESLRGVRTGCRIEHIETALHCIGLPRCNNLVHGFSFAQPVDAPVANFALLPEFLKGADSRSYVANADPAPFRLTLESDEIVQLDQVDAVKPETLQAAFDRRDDGIFDVMHLLGRQPDLCPDHDAGF